MASCLSGRVRVDANSADVSANDAKTDESDMSTIAKKGMISLYRCMIVTKADTT